MIISVIKYRASLLQREFKYIFFSNQKESTTDSKTGTSQSTTDSKTGTSQSTPVKVRLSLILSLNNSYKFFFWIKKKRRLMLLNTQLQQVLPPDHPRPQWPHQLLLWFSWSVRYYFKMTFFIFITFERNTFK